MSLFFCARLVGLAWLQQCVTLNQFSINKSQKKLSKILSKIKHVLLLKIKRETFHDSFCYFFFLNFLIFIIWQHLIYHIMGFYDYVKASTCSIDLAALNMFKLSHLWLLAFNYYCITRSKHLWPRWKGQKFRGHCKVKG